MSTQTNTSTDEIGQENSALGKKLEANGIDVVSLKRVAEDPYLRYAYDEDSHEKDILVIALIFATNPEEITEVVQIQAMEGNSGCGYLYIKRDLVEMYLGDQITKKQYATMVLNTWEEIEPEVYA